MAKIHIIYNCHYSVVKYDIFIKLYSNYKAMEGEIKRWEKFMIVLGVALLLAGFLTFYLTFITAYADPSKTVLVTINNYNEANPEFVLASVSLFLGIYAMSALIRKL